MKHVLTLFCLLLALGAGNFTAAKAQVNVNDSLALVNLYNSTKGVGWRFKTNWLTSKPVSTWYGITVTGTRVTSVSLPSNNLRGKIPASIGKLTNLQTLVLSINELAGSIPSSIGNLVNLETLSLFANNLIFRIPSSIGNLTNLHSLSLQGNKLAGSIPSSICNLINLQEINLLANNLRGPIPASIGNLVNLQYLNFSDNRLTGSIPASIGKLENINSFLLGRNQLSGPIPASLGNLKSLDFISLEGNQLSGAIPASIGNLENVRIINLSENKLQGSIPSSMGNLNKLELLFLSGNQLVGEIPYSFNNLTKLRDIYLSRNRLSQSSNLPFLQGSSQLSTVYLNDNHFTFNGLEYVAQKSIIALYSRQAIIPVHQNGDILSVYAGGTLNNNTYKWFRVGDVGSTTINGDSTFTPGQNGKYYVQVTNSIATQLTLYSDTIDFTMSSIIADNKQRSSVIRNKQNTVIRVTPNPANSIVQVQVNGSATILLTNSAGKIMLTRTIINKGEINVSALANGVYFIKNKHTGEVQKIVVAH